MASIFDQMLDQDTGEIDQIVLADAIEVRAASEYGAPGFPPKYRREAAEWCNERASNMRRAWRQHRGLPSEDAVTMMPVPGWGCSGDSFGRGR